MPSDLTTSIMKSAPTCVVVSGGGGGASSADCSIAPAIAGSGFGGASCAPAATGGATVSTAPPVANPLRIARRSTPPRLGAAGWRSEEHTSELQSLMRISYAVFCLKKNNHASKNYISPYYTIDSL